MLPLTCDSSALNMESVQPLQKSIFVRCTTDKAPFRGHDPEAVLLVFRDRIRLETIDNSREWNDPMGLIFLLILVIRQLVTAEDKPFLAPRLVCVAKLEQITLPDHFALKLFVRDQARPRHVCRCCNSTSLQKAWVVSDSVVFFFL